MKRLARSWTLLCTLLAACNQPAGVVGGLQEISSMRSLPNRDLDILFVIDDSPSTADKQTAFAAAFPQMMDVLSQIDGGLPNLHIGVITSDMGTSASATGPGPAVGQIGDGGCAGTGKNGQLQIANGAPVQGGFLSDIEDATGDRIKNYSGELRDVFTQMAKVGDGGCGFEQPLAAMASAFTNPNNAGFVRPDANLAVVFLQDEDDCSLHSSALLGPASDTLGPQQSFRCTRFGVECDQDMNQIGAKTHCRAASDTTYVNDVNMYVDALLAQKPDERMVMAAAVAGDPTPVEVELRSPPGGGAAIPELAHSCSFTAGDGTTAVADPAVRMNQFLTSFPDRNALTSVCNTDLSNPLQLIGESAKKMMGDPCLDTSELADVSAELPGVQPSCEVAEIRDSVPSAATLLPLCSSGAPDCFEIVADTNACPSTDDHLRVKIHRTSTPAADAWTHIRCQLAP